jgi:hypothetical protein
MCLLWQEVHISADLLLLFLWMIVPLPTDRFLKSISQSLMASVPSYGSNAVKIILLYMAHPDLCGSPSPPCNSMEQRHAGFNRSNTNFLIHCGKSFAPGLSLVLGETNIRHFLDSYTIFIN